MGVVGRKGEWIILLVRKKVKMKHLTNERTVDLEVD